VDVTGWIKIASLVVVSVAVLGSEIATGWLLLTSQVVPPAIEAIAGYGLLQALAVLGIHVATPLVSNGKKNGNNNPYSGPPNA